ncbi:hypothetical protein EV198_1598 [Roseivirga ehrenbergii]|uniref:Lipoprotein n=1 Tax=Roseivirga ehrenbergii (strain DSM 102268 / JCM 13514 / KCTC 12282 / NCIMB 14502 / KMM 6017) TaxID=279360 RepID=A0A150XRP1_ROSEK|nr:hypothetical protein [Roseivirga ehrenbergii]KYG81419.1 hypothetical protein MB14_12550 [Roseivirga ehrenbergii]TCL10568.1 hypothetical protein EV198_1598 [Roseivirga ehrenbergii]
MKKGELFLLGIILWFQACGTKTEQSTGEFQLTKEEQTILKLGIEPLLYADIETEKPRLLSDYLLVGTISDFSSVYSSDDSVGKLSSLFIKENQAILNQSVVFDHIPSVQTIDKKKLDSLGATVDRKDFWYNFHENWFPTKAGYIEVSKPIVNDDRTFFYFFHTESGKSGRLMRVWMIKNSEAWQIEKSEVIWTF